MQDFCISMLRAEGQHQVLRMRIARKYLLIQTILLPLQPRSMAAAGTFGNNNSPMNLMRPKPPTPLQKRGAFLFSHKL